MTRHARTLILALGALGLVASVASLYVHYQLIRDPAYSSFCDINETISCEALYQSAYGTLFGIPVAAGGVIWSALVLLLALLGMGAGEKRGTGDTSDAGGYVFLLSTIGIGVVLYLGYASFFVVKKACPLCITMYVSVLGTFVVSAAAAASSVGSLPSRLGRDLRDLVASPVAATFAVLWLVGSVSLVAFFPKEQSAADALASPAVPAGPTETMGPDERAQFEQWIQAQPRVTVPVDAGGALVAVVKFNDYQCPSCRQAYVEYRGIVAKYQKDFPDKVKFITMDFPLEAECNLAAVHPSACEAAAAVRMARARGKAEPLEEYFFGHQETMTKESVKQALRDIAGVDDFDAQYPKVLELVRAEAKIGRDLGVNGTPAFFINGIKVAGSLRPVYFDALIAYELKRTESARAN